MNWYALSTAVLYLLIGSYIGRKVYEGIIDDPDVNESPLAIGTFSICVGLTWPLWWLIATVQKLITT